MAKTMRPAIMKGMKKTHIGSGFLGDMGQASPMPSRSRMSRPTQDARLIADSALRAMTVDSRH